MLSEALYALEARGTLAPVAARTHIVTFSAKVGMPDAFKGRVFDVMGEHDQFGEFNSRPGIAADHVVPGAGHSTNFRAFPETAIDVTATLSIVLPMLGARRPLGTRPPAALAAFDLPQQLAGQLAA